VLKKILISCSLFVFSHLCMANVSVDINQKNFNFNSQPRLSEVISNVAHEADWYWPAAKLYKLDTQDAPHLRDEIVTKLKLLQLSLSEERSIKISDLIEQINSWQLADRILIRLDYDLVQTNAQFDPLFDTGSYRLDLLERPRLINFFGLIEQASSAKLNTNQCIADYIHEQFSVLLNKDYIYVVQPNGHTFKAGIAYWNASCVEIMPGSQIYIPLDESQFSAENRELNKKIVKLALNRILQ